MDSTEREGFLAHSQLSSFKKKVERSRLVISDALKLGIGYVGWSLGKDSTVLLHLVQQQASDIKVISFSHPDREQISNYSEVEKQYCSSFSPNLETIYIDGDHVPAKVKLAKLRELYTVGFIGLRKEESKWRKNTLRQVIYQYKDTNHKRACPLADWSMMDVWAYTLAHELPYLNAYDIVGSWGRTTDHISRERNRKYQETRLEEIKLININYYTQLCDEITQNQLQE